MRAVVITRHGGPEVLELRERPDPEVGPEDVLVRVRATAMNRADLLQRRGLYPAPPGVVPDVPGLEFAGEVVVSGARVCEWTAGDRVMGILGGGGHADTVVTHERMCLCVPGGLSWEQAAAIPEAFLTAFDALVLQGGLSPGESVLVPAAASGVGLAAVQIALAAGARPIGSSRTPRKREQLATLGLAAVLDLSAAGAADAVRGAAPRGIDVVLDLVGAPGWPLYLDVLAPRGRIVLVGTMGGGRLEIDASVLMRKRATVIGTMLRARPLEEKIAVTQAFARQMLPLIVAGRLHPVVDRVLDLSDAAPAHAAMESNANAGKIVLRV
jgi:putative PIG3 family NAD(P)H quinone oxidoreductase